MTKPTLESLLAHMGPQMALEGLQPAECPLTYLTLEALLLGVNVSVVLHEVAEL